jgi:hypothetical protein
MLDIEYEDQLALPAALQGAAPSDVFYVERIKCHDDKAFSVYYFSWDFFHS